MKTTKTNAAVTTDPWQALAGTGPLQAVPLEGVLARLHCTGRAAGAVRHDLLAEVNRLADGGAAHGAPAHGAPAHGAPAHGATKVAATATKPAFAG